MVIKRLRELRESSNLNQADVGAVLNITREAYCMYEKGKRQPSYATLICLADFYKVNMDYILGRTDISEPLPFISKEELFLIQLVRKADKRGKENVVSTIKYEATRGTVERPQNRIGP